MIAFHHLVLVGGILISNLISANVIPDKYIVTLKPGITQARAGAHVKWVTELQNGGLSRRDSTTGVGKVISLSTLGFYVYVGTFDATSISKIRNSSEVVTVEQDWSWSIEDGDLHRRDPGHHSKATP